MKLNITMTDENGNAGPLRPIINSGTRAAPTNISIPYLSVNPAICFWLNGICNVDTKQLSLIPEIQQTNTLYRMIFESVAENKSVNAQNSLTPPNIDDVSTDLGLYHDIFRLSKKINPAGGNIGMTPDVTALITKHMIWALKQQQYNFNNSCNNEITMQVPFPLFYADEPLFVGVGKKIVLRLSRDPMYAQNLICIAGSPHVASGAGNVGGGDYKVTTLPYPSVYANNTINVAVTDMCLFLCMADLAEESIPRSLTVYMKQFSPFVRPLLAANNNSFTVDLKDYRRMSHIAICFINKSNESFHQSPCDFTSGFTSLDNNNALTSAETYQFKNQISNLYQLYIIFGGTKYPMSEATLLTTNYLDTGDMARSWYETLVASDSLRDRDGSLIDFKTFLASPIFLWKTFQGLKQTTNNINVTINCSSQIPTDFNATTAPAYNSNINAFCLGLYDEMYKLQFDDQYRCISEDLDSTPIGIHE